MADVKISGLPASTVPLAGTEVLPLVQGGVTKKVAVSNLTGTTVSNAGEVGVGGDTAGVVAGVAVTSKFCVKQDGTNPVAGFVKAENTTANSGSVMFACRSRGTLAAPTVVQSGDSLWNMYLAGFDGTDLALAAEIDVQVDGTPGDNDMPGRILFKTTPDGSQIPVEALRINSSQVATFAQPIVGSISNLKSNATTGVLQVVGPTTGTTRVMTTPDANFTAARTDAAQTFTGAQTFSTPVEVTSGGSGTSTAFTTGSVVFAGASGVYSQKNTAFFWNNTDNRLGLNIATPTDRLHVYDGIAKVESTVGGATSAYFYQVSPGFTGGLQTKRTYSMQTSSWITDLGFFTNALGQVGAYLNLGGASHDAGFELRFLGTVRQKWFSSGGVSVGNTTDPGASNLSVTGTIASASTIKGASTISVGNATPSASGAGITFPATQSASSDANTLDDYEEGTWTPNQGAGLTVVGAFSSSAVYTKVGRLVTVSAKLSGVTSIAVTAGGILCTNLPFTVGTLTGVGSMSNGNPNQFSCVFVNTGSTNAFASGAITASFDIFFTVTYAV